MLGSDESYQPLTIADLQDNIVMATEIQLTADSADDVECAIFIRTQPELDSGVRVAIANNNLITLEDRFQDEVVN